MKILVTGSRAWSLPAVIHAALAAIPGGPHTLVHGGARGADAIAARWARANGWQVKEYPANWERDGHAAGPIRNQRMLDAEAPDLVLAFPRPTSVGTYDCVKRARSAGYEVREFLVQSATWRVWPARRQLVIPCAEEFVWGNKDATVLKLGVGWRK